MVHFFSIIKSAVANATAPEIVYAKRNGDSWQPGEYQPVNLWRIVVLLLKLQLITDLSRIIGLHYRKLLQVTMEICN